MTGAPMVPAAPPGLADGVLARRRRRLRIPRAWRQPLAVTGLAVVGAWLVIGLGVYAFYGIKHSHAQLAQSHA